MIKLQEKQLVNIRNSSKGNQLKRSDGKLWYKADYLGYESLYGQQFCFWFSDKDVEEYLEKAEGYDDTVKQRVLEVLRGQIRKYQYLKQKR